MIFFHPKFFLGLKFAASLLLHEVKWFASWFGVFPRQTDMFPAAQHMRDLRQVRCKWEPGCVGRRPSHACPMSWEDEAPISRWKMQRCSAFCDLEMHVLIASCLSATWFVALTAQGVRAALSLQFHLRASGPGVWWHSDRASTLSLDLFIAC